jgi:hypothetical protein
MKLTESRFAGISGYAGLTSITGWREEHTNHGWAENATFSILQAKDEEFALIFPRAGQDLEVVEDFANRVGEEAAGLTLTPLWQRPNPKEDVQGIHGTLILWLAVEGQISSSIEARGGSGCWTAQRMAAPSL